MIIECVTTSYLIFFFIFYSMMEMALKSLGSKPKWASTWENLSSGVWEQQRCRPACASPQAAQRLCYSFFWKAKGTVQSLYNTIFGFIGLHHLISELCYKGTILQRKYRKMTILWSFFYNSFLIFHDLKFGNHNMTVFYPNPCFFKVYYKGTALYLVN